MEGYGTSITALIILIGLWIFRVQISQLVEWIVRIRKVEKTKDGYSVQGAEPLSPLTSATPQEQKLLEVTRAEPGLSSREEKLLIDATASPVGETATADEESWATAWFAGDYGTASKLIQREIDKPPSDKGDGKAWLRSLQASMIFSLNTKDGIEKFKELTKSIPTEHEPYIWWAVSHRKINQFNDALEILARGVPLVVNKAALLAEQVTTLRQAGKTPEAISVALAVLKDFPEAQDIYRQLAEMYLEQKALPQVVSILEKGISHCAGSESLRAKLATVYQDNGAPEFAAYQYAVLIDMFPKNASYPALLANAYLDLEYYERAMVKYRVANVLAEEKEGWILGNIGNLLHRRGLHSEAIEYLKRAAAVDPESEYVHRRLAEAMNARDEEKKNVDAMFAKLARKETPLPEKLRAPTPNDAGELVG